MHKGHVIGVRYMEATSNISLLSPSPPLDSRSHSPEVELALPGTILPLALSSPGFPPWNITPWPINLLPLLQGLVQVLPPL